MLIPSLGFLGAAAGPVHRSPWSCDRLWAHLALAASSGPLPESWGQFCRLLLFFLCVLLQFFSFFLVSRFSDSQRSTTVFSSPSCFPGVSVLGPGELYFAPSFHCRFLAPSFWCLRQGLTVWFRLP